MELSINSTRLSSKMGKKGDFLSRSFLCILLVLLFLILGRRGSYVAAIQRRILFTMALYYFCTDKLCTQSHQFSPFLSLSVFLSLHILLTYKDLTSRVGKVRAGNFWCKAVWKVAVSAALSVLGENRWHEHWSNNCAGSMAHFFKLWTEKKNNNNTTVSAQGNSSDRVQFYNSASLSSLSFPLSLSVSVHPLLFS